MSAGRYNIRLEKGSVFRREINIIGNDGRPLDLSGYLASMMVRTPNGDLVAYWSEENGGIKNWRSAAPGKLVVWQSASANSLFATSLEGANKYDLELRHFYIDDTTYWKGDTTFTGTGVQDMTVSGTYTGTTTSLYNVNIVAGDPTNPNTFRWNKDGGAYSPTYDIRAGCPFYLENGIYVTFAAATGHVAADTFAFYATKFVFDGADTGWLDTGSIALAAPPSAADYFRPMATVTGLVFSGAGLNDFYEPEQCDLAWPQSQHIHVKVSTAGGTDKFQWSIDGGTTWMSADGVALGETSMVAATWMPLSYGGSIYTYVKWATATGHTANNYWHFTIAQPVVIISSSSLTNGNGVYAVRRVVITPVSAPPPPPYYPGTIQKMYFSRQLDSGDGNDAACIFNRIVVGGMYALRILEGTFNIVPEQTRNVYPL